jgi:short-subunit dehydrogenase
VSVLDGQKALVTGASGAIGGALALALARRGVRLLLSGRNPERLEATADRVREAGVEARIAAGDLADDDALRRLADAASETDLLVHALGAYHAGSVAATEPAALDHQLRVNLRVPYELTRRLLPSLRERRGQVVFVSSSAAVQPRGPIASYAASKAALTAFATCLRDEVSPDGVRVLSVYPGRTASAMQEEVHRLEGRAYEPARLLQPAEVASTIVHALELPRSAEVTDIHIRPAYPP